MYTLDLVSWTANKSYESIIFLNEVDYHMSSCLRLGVDTQYNVFKIIVHGCSIIYIQSCVSTVTSSSLYQILKLENLGSIHNNPCPSETIERIGSLM